MTGLGTPGRRPDQFDSYQGARATRIVEIIVEVQTKDSEKWFRVGKNPEAITSTKVTTCNSIARRRYY
jgi:hypothetical protein